MPAYFSLNFEVSKSKTAIRDFCNALIGAGLAFKSGFWGFESDSLNDIIEWNQMKLDANFQLGYAEHYSHDYKQLLFDYCGFSEVRVFLMNDKLSPTFDFCLIIPEDDFLEYVKQGDEYVINRKNERMDLVKSLAKKMWSATGILAIQTAWECSDYVPRARHISNTTPPQIEPFCIIKDSSVAEKLDLPFVKVEPEGVLIEACDRWNYM